MEGNAEGVMEPCQTKFLLNLPPTHDMANSTGIKTVFRQIIAIEMIMKPLIN